MPQEHLGEVLVRNELLTAADLERAGARKRSTGKRFCPSCEKKRSILWAEWLRKEVLEPVPHRHVVLTMPRLLRPLFRRHNAY